MKIKVKVGDKVIERGSTVAETITSRTNKTIATDRFTTKGRLDNFRLYDEAKVNRIKTIQKQIQHLQKEQGELFYSLDEIE